MLSYCAHHAFLYMHELPLWSKNIIFSQYSYSYLPLLWVVLTQELPLFLPPHELHMIKTAPIVHNELVRCEMNV
jgi:hypothetical protein